LIHWILLTAKFISHYNQINNDTRHQFHFSNINYKFDSPRPIRISISHPGWLRITPHTDCVTNLSRWRPLQCFYAFHWDIDIWHYDKISNSFHSTSDNQFIISKHWMKNAWMVTVIQRWQCKFKLRNDDIFAFPIFNTPPARRRNIENFRASCNELSSNQLSANLSEAG
jgi:hypothetical protein